MESIKFIKSKIEKLLKAIPELEIYYEYDSFSDSHFLKVLPLYQFNQNELYIQFEQEFANEFFEKYPFELITFLSENDDYEMVSAEKYFVAKSTIEAINKHFDFNDVIESLLLDYKVELPSNIDFSTIYNSTKKNLIISESYSQKTKFSKDFNLHNENQDTYSLAA